MSAAKVGLVLLGAGFALSLLATDTNGVAHASTPAVYTRTFHGTAVANLTITLNPLCSSAFEGSLAITISRPRIKPWTATFSGCAQMGPTPEDVSFNGALSMYTGRGTSISGVGYFVAAGGLLSSELFLSGSDGEFAGGYFNIYLGTDPSSIHGSVDGSVMIHDATG